MKLVYLVGAICLVCSCNRWIFAQDLQTPAVLKHRPVKGSGNPKSILSEHIDLTVAKGTALQVVLDREVRVRSVGQPIQGHLIEPIYAFDKLVLPVGTKVTGQIVQIESVSSARRVFAALDADLTPARQITVAFTELSLADGRHLPLKTSAVTGSGEMVRFVPVAENSKGKSVGNALAEMGRDTKRVMRQQFVSAMQHVKKPGRLHRLERYAVAQLPVHPQYLNAGTTYFAELGNALEFGSEPLTREVAASMNPELAAGKSLQAQLMTALSSATTRKGSAVEAVVSRPLVNDGKLILPQGSVLKGTVVQVKAARYWKHNGQLRFVFHDLVLPNEVGSKVDAMVQGIQSGSADHLHLDAEGGAEAQTPKTRYLRSGIALSLAAATHEDELSNRAEGGAGGFKVIGIAIGTIVHSQPLAIAMGAFGASRSFYNNFVARGTEVVFPKHTEMKIGIDTRHVSAPGEPEIPASNNTPH